MSLRENAGGGVEDEAIDVLELPFSQALEMIRRGEICDGKTVILLQYLQHIPWVKNGANPQ
ncbi:hypothetical protein ACLK2H_14055 [Escherichia coli]